VFAPLIAAAASRAQMLAIPVAITSRSLAPNSSPACDSASRLVGPSPNHAAP
jgi:hypothetical protein